MAKKQYGNSEAKNRRWIKEGRGSGQGKDYKPWLTVRDLPSEGRSHRVFGHKSQRTHHLLSDLELAVFLLLEWSTKTTDIREQFPLRLEDTLSVAVEAGIAHPSLRGVNQIMSSDFLVNASDRINPKFVLQAKYEEAFHDIRTVEKLELERRYWIKKNVPWMLITEKDIPKVVFQNIGWLYPAQRDELENQTVLERVDFYTHYFYKKPNDPLIEIAKQLDMAYDLPAGQSLLEIRQLMARRSLIFDILIPHTKLKSSDLSVGRAVVSEEVQSVSSQ
ncbi:heteromeric transposase endonuclease subunit TnsA [Thalassotalea sp. G20_0]|uniref:TnsA endonuclease C-terminal domain-containing protein n=1 Tax=Thalassotalea sp. G20_0 TaxID=2821093 RepID=UPI001AD9EB96|nr:TnsA endonuclease C-terminal domain-containing protein [Thalassotalea sp. G20_0]MBO9496488.1 heteromeric transposase endonuclease subunit TnsA [Thalassotalea sp. G20_0]